LSEMTNAAAEIAVPIEAWTYWLHPIFARCVDPEAVRFDLSRPFVVEEYVYATNGRIAVRMPVPAGWAIPDPERVPRSVADMFRHGRWREEPTQFPPVEGTCKICEGSKVQGEIVCPYCRAESPGPYEAGFCGECWQLEGKLPAGPCYECGGTGLHDHHGRIEVVPGYYLARDYVALLHEFEMTTYLPVEFYEKVGRDDVGQTTRFTQGDVTGILMAMTRPDKESHA
jgi:hypothetical protein